MKKQFGIAGFLGFLGFLFFLFNKPFCLVFFSFFSFFAFGEWGKYRDVVKDEKFLANKAKAFQKSVRLGGVIIFIVMILLTTTFSWLDIYNQYTLFIASISLCFSLINISFAYLTAKYNK